MPWLAVTIKRRGSVRMPDRCAYCNGPADRRLPLRTSRRLASHTGRMTRTLDEEKLEIPVPFCALHGARADGVRRELRLARRLGGAAGAVLGLLVVLLLFDIDGATRVPLAIMIGAALGVLAFVATALVARGLPRYRDYGAGMLGVDLAAGAEALTFRFTNPVYAATFRSRNGIFG
jgi:hypothetical protein